MQPPHTCVCERNYIFRCKQQCICMYIYTYTYIYIYTMYIYIYVYIHVAERAHKSVGCQPQKEAWKLVGLRPRHLRKTKEASDQRGGEGASNARLVDFSFGRI